MKIYLDFGHAQWGDQKQKKRWKSEEKKNKKDERRPKLSNLQQSCNIYSFINIMSFFSLSLFLLLFIIGYSFPFLFSVFAVADSNLSLLNVALESNKSLIFIINHLKFINLLIIITWRDGKQRRRFEIGFGTRGIHL